MHDLRVRTVALDGSSEDVVVVPGQPSGLGWGPDGRLLVVSMTDRRLLRLEDHGLVEVADLRQLATWHCNDMVVDERGRAYIGNFGSEPSPETGLPAPTALVLVAPDGRARAVANDLAFPNGTVITPDGRTLIVGESYGACLTAFDIDGDGSLSNRRIWAKLQGAVPDGCCLDAEGAIWVASPVSHAVLRVREGGEVLDRVEVERQAYACMLGGSDRRTLFVLTASSPDPAHCRRVAEGRIEIVQVDIPGVGLP